MYDIKIYVVFKYFIWNDIFWFFFNCTNFPIYMYVQLIIMQNEAPWLQIVNVLMINNNFNRQILMSAQDIHRYANSIAGIP